MLSNCKTRDEIVNLWLPDRFADLTADVPEGVRRHRFDRFCGTIEALEWSGVISTEEGSEWLSRADDATGYIAFLHPDAEHDLDNA